MSLGWSKTLNQEVEQLASRRRVEHWTELEIQRKRKSLEKKDLERTKGAWINTTEIEETIAVESLTRDLILKPENFVDHHGITTEKYIQRKKIRANTNSYRGSAMCREITLYWEKYRIPVVCEFRPAVNIIDPTIEVHFNRTYFGERKN